MRAHRFSPQLQGRVRAYYAHVAAQDLLTAEERCLERLSPELREDVLLSMYHDLLQSMPFFAEKSTAFMLHVVQVLDTLVVPPAELLVSAVRPWLPLCPCRVAGASHEHGASLHVRNTRIDNTALWPCGWRLAAADQPGTGFLRVSGARPGAARAVRSQHDWEPGGTSPQPQSSINQHTSALLIKARTKRPREKRTPLVRSFPGVPMGLGTPDAA